VADPASVTSLLPRIRRRARPARPVVCSFGAPLFRRAPRSRVARGRLGPPPVRGPSPSSPSGVGALFSGPLSLPPSGAPSPSSGLFGPVLPSGVWALCSGPLVFRFRAYSFSSYSPRQATPDLQPRSSPLLAPHIRIPFRLQALALRTVGVGPSGPRQARYSRRWRRRRLGPPWACDFAAWPSGAAAGVGPFRGPLNRF